MDVSNEPAEQEERFDKWAIRRIMDGRKCCLVTYLSCIPTRTSDCRACYRKDASEMEGTLEYRAL